MVGFYVVGALSTPECGWGEGTELAGRERARRRPLPPPRRTVTARGSVSWLPARPSGGAFPRISSVVVAAFVPGYSSGGCAGLSPASRAPARVCGDWSVLAACNARSDHLSSTGFARLLAGAERHHGRPGGPPTAPAALSIYRGTAEAIRRGLSAAQRTATWQHRPQTQWRLQSGTVLPT